MLDIRAQMLKTKEVVSLEDPDLSEIEWAEETVSVEDVGVVGPAEWFLLSVGRLMGDRCVEKTRYVKPVKPYHNFVFEDLFNFGCQCEGYTTDRIIKVTW